MFIQLFTLQLLGASKRNRIAGTLDVHSYVPPEDTVGVIGLKDYTEYH